MATNLGETEKVEDKLRVAFRMYDKDSSGNRLQDVQQGLIR